MNIRIGAALFEKELDLIVNEDLRIAVKNFLDENVGEWFYSNGASASGKFHPEFARGEGGLVRHTKAVVMFATELLRMSSYAYMPDEYKDYVIAACILHDTRKYGGLEYDKTYYKHHGREAAEAFKNWCLDVYGTRINDYLYNAIKNHMGQWSTDREDKPFTQIDRCVHLADYMASRNFIDIPCLHLKEEEA